MATSRQQFLAPVHSFRAIAIFLVVLGHCLPSTHGAPEPPWLPALNDLLQDGSVAFVFIAGYLFHFLSGSFGYAGYLQKKFEHVLVPYLLVSVPAIVLAVCKVYPHSSYAPPDWPWPAQALWYLGVGGAHGNFPLWFIPMITLFYLAAPLFIAVIRRPVLYWLVPPLAVLSALLKHPATPNVDVIRSALYCLPAYLLGMACSQFSARAPRWLTEHPYRLAGLALWVLLLPLAASPHGGTLNTEHWFDLHQGLVDWVFVQKLLLSPLLLWLLAHAPARLHQMLAPWATVSFGLFFIHGYWLLLVAWVISRVELPLALFLPVTGSLVLALSYLSVQGVRLWMPGHSRSLVGC